MFAADQPSQARSRDAGPGFEPDEKLNDPARAWAPYEPSDRAPWNLARAGHLYRRAAFGATWPQLQRALGAGPQETVDKLLRLEADVAQFNSTYDRYEDSAARANSTGELRGWWLRRMLATPFPLLEKMTLFWHDHFGTGNARVNSPMLMSRHVQLLRSHALGHVGPMMEAVSRDPATLVGLGAEASRKAQPNTNFAQELLDRFSLGSGNYAEEDIAEAARAFTGSFVLQDQFRYVDREHDTGTKRVFGQEGNWADSDVVRIVLRQPAAPRFLVRKLYRWLISDTDRPSDALIAPLADAFSADYDVARLVQTILRSNLFFSQRAYRRKIKSPIEFAVGIVSALEGMVPTVRLGQDVAALGQDLYNPPTVDGWPSGRRWINSATLVGRNNLALALTGAAGPYANKLDPAEVAARYGGKTPQAAARLLIDLFLQGDLEPGVVDALLEDVLPDATSGGGDRSNRLRRFAHAVTVLPEFQLA